MSDTVQIRVDKTKELGKLEHAWRYIGYDECNYTYIPEGEQLLEKFRELSAETRIPATRLLDEAIEDLLVKYNVIRKDDKKTP